MKTTDLLGIGMIGVLAYVVWQGGKDVFAAGGEIIKGISGAPALISQYLNPLDYGPSLLTALSEYQAASAAYGERIQAVETEISERRIAGTEVQLAIEEYRRDPSIETRTTFLEQYRESYEKQLAHVSPGWQPITVSGEVMETAEEFLETTLIGKGLSQEEVSFITGISPSLPDPLSPSEAHIATDPVSEQASEDLAERTRTSRQEEGTWEQSREDADIEAYREKLASGEFTQKQYEYNVQYFAGR